MSLAAKNGGILGYDDYMGGAGIILKAGNVGCSFSYTASTEISPTGNWYIISPQNDFSVDELDQKCGIYSRVLYFDADDNLK